MTYKIKLVAIITAGALMTGCMPIMTKVAESDLGQKMTGVSLKFREAKENDSPQTRAEMEVLYKWGEQYCQNFKGSAGAKRWDISNLSANEYSKSWARAKNAYGGYRLPSDGHILSDYYSGGGGIQTDYIHTSHPTKIHAGVTCNYRPGSGLYTFIEMWVANNGTAYFYAPNLHVINTAQIPPTQLLAIAGGKMGSKTDNGEF